MLALTYEGGINDQSEQCSSFSAEGIFPSRKGNGKCREGPKCARPCRREEAQDYRTHLEQGSPQPDRRPAKTTLGEGKERSRPARQVVNRSIFANAAAGLVRTFSQDFADGAWRVLRQSTVSRLSPAEPFQRQHERNPAPQSQDQQPRPLVKQRSALQNAGS